ncbi:MAG: ADP-ribosylglycohydrolase family protein [Bacteroidales bacterium]|nr:ADP-ribosylglycohydrolase family protein [Bacteroidales bacterium]
MKIQLTNPVLNLLFILGLLFTFSCGNDNNAPASSGVDYPVELTVSKSDLLNKIKGGWAGQVIGCTYGGPTEFKFNGTMIQEYTPIEWDENMMEWWYSNAPGLYDDIYMDLTFVEVIEMEGVDAPASCHAHAFANAEYKLWHANQAARYNILRGMEPPASGYWENNPHADDIDFQIEADFAGLMNPGMVNSSSEICDRVGHIMNYGDGWYGGVYVAAMYSLAFYSDDIGFIVSEALKAIPEESEFHQCIKDVIQWHGQNPDDWRSTWFEAEKKWSSDIGCPSGVFSAFNIDAKINAAYIVIGLLYGEGDFGKTVDISTRCGQDSDCNPASAGGILGTVIGYDGIPDYWKQGLDRVEDMDFKYTTISLNDAYEMSYRHALEMIRRNGGEEQDEEVKIIVEEPSPVKFERAFEGHYPVRKINFGWGGKLLEADGETDLSFDFKGKGFVIKGRSVKHDGALEDKDLLLDVFIDGALYETSAMPTSERTRKHEVAWKYNLDDGDHTVRVVLKDPEKGYGIHMHEVIIYGTPPSGL